MAKSRRRKPIRTVRCAIYTRKSHEEGLDQEFNSLDQQREAADAYIASQKDQGWVVTPERYDDPALSAATLDRPALRQLVADIEAGLVDVVVVYKIDRLSRSLRDFGRLMDLFERHGVSFVSVTQRFDTSSSMGKLTLNVLMSFAEFEREVIGERIRDKLAAHKRRGKHTGGMPILGYDTDREAKRLVVNTKEARLVRRIFRRFTELRSTTQLAKELNRQGHRTKAWTTVKGQVRGGRRWNKGHIYRLLNNVKYLGKVDHKGKIYDGEHAAIITQKLWDAVHEILSGNHKARGNHSRAETPALLKGVIRCGHCGSAMGPTFTTKRGKRYHYYLCVHASKNGYGECPVKSVAAGEIEDAVVNQLRAVFRAPELVTRTYREAKAREVEEIERLQDEKARLRKLVENDPDVKDQLEIVQAHLRAIQTNTITERDVIDALEQLDPIWDELFPAEQCRIVQLLVERVDVYPDAIDLRIHGAGLRSLVSELAPTEATGVRAG